MTIITIVVGVVLVFVLGFLFVTLVLGYSPFGQQSDDYGQGSVMQDALRRATKINDEKRGLSRRSRERVSVPRSPPKKPPGARTTSVTIDGRSFKGWIHSSTGWTILDNGEGYVDEDGYFNYW